MSYLVKQKRRRRPAKRQGMGGFVEDVSKWVTNLLPGNTDPPNAEILGCLDQAHAATAQLDAKTKDLNLNWKPSGFYSPDQVNQLVQATIDVLNRAGSSIDSALADGYLADSVSQLNQGKTDINNRLAQAGPYLNAARAAQSSGAAAVDSPGLKTWIVNSMTTASSTLDRAYVIACSRPWWLSIYNAFAATFDALWKLAKAIVGVVVAVGQTVVKVAGELPDLFTLVKWGGLAALAAYAVVKIGEARKART